VKMADVAVIVSVPTSCGSREPIDLAQPVLNWQKLENPQVSLLQCGSKYGPQAVRSMFEKLADRDQASTFEEINLSDNVLGNEGAVCLATNLENNKSLKRLIVPRAGIGAAGVSSMGNLMATAHALEVLILSGNFCDKEGVAGPFADGLKANKTLKSLCLADCRLGDAGAEAIKAAASAHPQLEHLSLAYNRLEATMVPCLPLSPSGALTFLDLSGNSLGPTGAKDLAEALKASNSKLTKISVAQNMIKTEGAKVLCEHFASAEGQILEFLDLRHNAVGYRGVKEIREMLGKTDMGIDNDGWLMIFNGRQLFLSGL